MNWAVLPILSGNIHRHDKSAFCLYTRERGRIIYVIINLFSETDVFVFRNGL